jgi:demethylspheroidene O-methyltransferase
LLTNRTFQRWAVRLPGARLIADRRASALFELCAGFVYSQVLFAGVRLKLFEMLAEGPQTVAQLAPRLTLSLEATTRLLEAAASLQLAERRPHQRFGLGIHGASLISNPAVAQMVEHHAMLYRDLADPESLLRGTAPSTELNRFWSYAGHGPGERSTPEQVAQYSALMAGSMELLAQDILDAYPLHQHRHLMDLAGGEGAFVEAAARTAGLALTLFDLPAVANRARARLANAGLADRVTVVEGDLFTSTLPQGADLISLVRVVHDHDDIQALRILAVARRALGPGGVLLLAEPMAGTSGSQRMGAYFGFYLMAMGQGRPRTWQELARMCHEAGFSRVRLAPTRRPMLTRVIVAQVD